MWTHSKQLPDWAFKQQEINGNKNPTEKTATWFVDEIISDESELHVHPRVSLLTQLTLILAGEEPKNRTQSLSQKEPKSMNFFRKFAELQLLMMQHNAGLTASHPYASSPINWPFVLTGISFWTENENQKQIYLIGNLFGWWACVLALSIYVGVLGADLLARHRGMDPIPDGMYFQVQFSHFF
jgi:dolichyl-phosphate-mannose-protein mannosyltransferase